MAIKRVEIKGNADIFSIFKGEFALDFATEGVNVLIGENGTGKTTILKVLNGVRVRYGHEPFLKFEGKDMIIKVFLDDIDNIYSIHPLKKGHLVYIPEKDILEHAKGLLTFIEEKQSGFGLEYKELLVKAQDIPTIQQTDLQMNIRKTISNIIGGEIEYDLSGGEFVTIRSNGARIPFAKEASGFKKLGLLGLLVKCGQLENGSVLFWDEPENSLNRELVPRLVEILLVLAKNGVQIFIATHDYHLARYFDIRKDKYIPVIYHRLFKSESSGIDCVSSPEYTKLPENPMEKASEKLYEAVISDAFGVEEDE
jgi:energy-coupling factor transporter ATP-binding protein EcfA2